MINRNNFFTKEGEISATWEKDIAEFIKANGKEPEGGDYQTLVKTLTRLMNNTDDESLWKNLDAIVNRMPKIEQYKINLNQHGYNAQIYKRMLFLMMIADFLEDRKPDENAAFINAYKLTVMFGDVYSALTYLFQHKTQNPDITNPINDACSFSMPATEYWPEDLWQKFCRKCLILPEIRDHDVILYAPMIKLHELAEENKWDLNKLGGPQTKTAQAIVKKLVERAIQYLYPRAKEDPFAAAEFAECRLEGGQRIHKRIFDDYLNLVKPNFRTKPGKVPHLVIDGIQLDWPGYYLIKLSDDDPRGALLGHLTASCQNLAGTGNGRDAAIYGMTNENAGFYVICRGKPPAKGDTKLISQKDIVAQAFAWEGQKGELVLDSLESLPKMNKTKLSRMTAALAKTLVDEHGFKQVNIGQAGQTPDLLKFDLLDEKSKATPITQITKSKSDSDFQARIYSKEFPLYANILCSPAAALEEFFKMPQAEKEKYNFSIICKLLIEVSADTQNKNNQLNPKLLDFFKLMLTTNNFNIACDFFKSMSTCAVTDKFSAEKNRLFLMVNHQLDVEKHKEHPDSKKLTVLLDAVLTLRNPNLTAQDILTWIDVNKMSISAQPSTSDPRLWQAAVVPSVDNLENITTQLKQQVGSKTELTRSK